MGRRQRYDASLTIRGFTPIYQRELQLLGLLPLGVSKAHVRSLSFCLALPRWVLWPLLTSRSASQRCPFRRKARPPQVRNHAFRPQPPNLRRRPLVAGVSQSVACSPRSATPLIRFLYVGSDFRSTLLSAYASRRTALRFA